MASVPKSSTGRGKAMADTQDINVEQIMQQVWEKIRSRKSGPASSGLTYPSSEAQIAADLTALHSGHDVYRAHFPSHRRVLGRFIIFVKKTLLQLLTPVFVKQAAYNAANTRVMVHLMGQLTALDEQQRQMRVEGLSQQALTALEARLGELEEQQRRALRALEARLEGLEAQRRQTLPR